MKTAKQWLPTFAALVVLMSHAEALKSLPFNKPALVTSTTTTTTTTAATENPTENNDTTPKPDNVTSSSSSSSHKKLTGIPQIDYVWDPNLPRELNGYNLSSYPFFSTVPPNDEIHFKCDGLHDGFYASIEFNCQVYHHCIYGIRHDFLCANFTAFDQRTFICHFASQVDCVNSDKYWHRNDNLYMATTTTTTSTTTTEAPITQAPLRRRPGRRPLRRRRPVDYYYDEEDYDDDYFEEKMNRRNKQRSRGRKPITDYDDDYEDKRSFSSDDEKRRPNSRDRFRDDDLEDDYEGDRSTYDSKPRSRNKSPVADSRAERRKLPGRKPGTISGRPSAEERRSLSDDRPGRKQKPRSDETLDVADLPRKSGGRRRINGEKRPAPVADDENEKPQRRNHEEDAVDAEDEEVPVHETPKPTEKELVKPQSSVSSGMHSIYDRPRAPPRIPRPVPINEKKKFQYSSQKTATIAAPAAADDGDEEYYEDEDYENIRGPRQPIRRRVHSKPPIDDDEPLPRRVQDIPRRGHSDSPLRKPNRPSSRKPTSEHKPQITDEEDYESIGKVDPITDEKLPQRRRTLKDKTSPITVPSGKGGQDVDFIDDDYEDHPRIDRRKKVKAPGRKHLRNERIPVDDIDDDADSEDDDFKLEERPLRNRDRRRKTANHSNQKDKSERKQHTHTGEVTDEDAEESYEDEKPTKDNTSAARPSVRVVKRPFLPSRGGSPYLPRGLQPVGSALKQSPTTDGTPIDMGSTISGVRLLEHGAPLLRNTGSLGHEQKNSADGADTIASAKGHRTTLPPHSSVIAGTRDSPKVSLDELYENDYDVTLNDALNPTLKPLAPSHNFPSAFTTLANNYNNNNFDRNINYNNNNPNAYIVPINNYNSDSYFSSTDVRRRTVVPTTPRNSRTEYQAASSRIAQHFYDDPDY